jgi:hypothetical protein
MKNQAGIDVKDLRIAQDKYKKRKGNGEGVVIGGASLAF